MQLENSFGVVGYDAWKAKLHLKLKLGPISMEFFPDLTREHAAAPAGRVVLAAKASEAKGRGDAEATIEATVADVGAGTRVDLVTDQ